MVAITINSPPLLPTPTPTLLINTTLSIPILAKITIIPLDRTPQFRSVRLRRARRRLPSELRDGRSQRLQLRVKRGHPRGEVRVVRLVLDCLRWAGECCREGELLRGGVESVDAD